MLFLDWLGYEDIAKGDLVVKDDSAFIVSISGSHPQIFISALNRMAQWIYNIFHHKDVLEQN